jgi:predicted permease
MSSLRQAFIDFKVRVRSLFGRRKMRARMDEEMRAHVEMRESRLVAAGATPAQAKRQARREFGNMAALRDSAADMWKYGSVERLVQDVRYGMRTLGRTPGFTAIAVLVLALGIGVNATVFTVTNAYLLRLLPVPDASRVVRAYSNNFSNTGLRRYEALRDGNSTLEGLAAFQMLSAGYRLDREVEHTYGQLVSGNYFPLMRVKAGHGRVIDESDDRAAAAPVTVLSHRFWQSRFAGSRDVVGRTIALNDHTFTIVGVAEPGFTGAMSPLVPDFWVPLSADAVLRPSMDAAARAESMSVHMLGRLKPDASRVSAESDLDTIGRRLRVAAGDTDNTDRAVSVYPAMMLNPEIAIGVGIFAGVLTIIVGLVLMIVCVNVANLVLARAASRGIELAIRQSMGAGRGRLVRQLLTENLLLSCAGAAGGAAIAYALTQTLARAIAQTPMPFPIELDLSMDWRVLAFLMVVVAGATLTFGAVPALGAAKLDLVGVLKGVAGLDRRHGRARTGFLIAQVSLSVLLLVTSGLFILALRSAQTMDTGFDGRQVMTASIDLEARGYTPERGQEFLRILTERLNASPGIVSSNVVDMLPLTLSNRANYLLRDGDVVSPDTRRSPMPIVYQNGVGPGHFKTLQIDLVAGRDFTFQDTSAAPRVAIVNEALARRFWPGRSAIGQRLRPSGHDGESIEVVGVARDSKYVTVGEEDQRPFLYQPLAQAYAPQPAILVRAAGEPGSVVPTLRQVVREMDPGLPVFNLTPMDEATAISLLPARVAGGLLTALGALALALSALGTFGVLSFLVRSRARELAIRLAIGATPRAIARMVVGQALAWTGVGTAIGLAMAFGLTRFLASFLYGVNPSDPVTFAGVALLIALVACAAAAIPARRASRQDPLATLRDA